MANFIQNQVISLAFDKNINFTKIYSTCIDLVVIKKQIKRFTTAKMKKIHQIFRPQNVFFLSYTEKEK